MEQVNYCKQESLHLISEELYNRLNRLGLIPNKVRNGNVGKSDYSKHTIQPWSIWIDYNLNPWDADIIKRTLRTKEEPGMTPIEARIMDYDKIEHICQERKRQLKTYITMESPTVILPTDIIGDFAASTLTNKEEKIITYNLKGKEIEAYNSFREKHKNCGGGVMTCFSHESGIGVTVRMYCPDCNEFEEITDVSNW